MMSMTMIVAALTGCGSSSNGSTKISVVGSTTVADPMEKLVEVYKQTNGEANIEVQGNGSSAGIKAVADGTADIGMASRAVTEEEKALGLTETEIGRASCRERVYVMV